MWRRNSQPVLLIAIIGCVVVYLIIDRQEQNISPAEDTPPSSTETADILHSHAHTGSSLLGSDKRPQGRRRRRFLRGSSAPEPKWTTTLYYNASSTPQTFRDWKTTKSRMCSGRFVGYANAFSLLKNVLLDKKHCRSRRLGGEPINSVVNQDEEAEYYLTESGCFRMVGCPSNDLQTYFFGYDQNHLNSWMTSVLQTDNNDNSSPYDKVITEFTIAVKRYEYVNLYHTMTDWYNAFLMIQFFGRTPRDTNILIVDSHPYGTLDPVWPQLFNSTFRLSSLPNRTLFRRLVWSVLGYQSPMTTSIGSYPPLYDEFRRHVLSSYALDWNRTRSCHQPMVRFIWRRDYVAHPRNPSGLVKRKIRNEVELLQYIRSNHPEYSVEGVQVDALPMVDQLRYIINADVLVGVHGAGLAHALFLPNRAGLIEIAPNEAWSASEHFEAIASWRRLTYRRWTNLDMLLENEAEGWLAVRPSVISALVAKVVRLMCTPTSRQTTETVFSS